MTKKKKNSKALELNGMKCKKKIYGAAWHLITKKTEKMFVYMRGDRAVIKQI